MRSLYIAVPLIALLVAAIAFSVAAWTRLTEVQIPLSGWLAIAGGVLVTLLIGGGLMALVFYSNRKGYDARARSVDERRS